MTALRRIVLVPLVLLFAGCPADDETPDTASDASADADAAATDAATDDTTSDNDTTPAADTTPGDDAAPDEDAAPGEDAEVDSPPDVSESDTVATEVLVNCHDLDYGISCEKPTPDANGYLACSDYFGNILGIEVQCSANPNADVRPDGPPCAAYEHYVGSCVYYNEALSDRCWVTHVGASSADLIDAGREFWRTNCAGDWME
ncbi:MAG: hypothetical protein H6697_10085 [Myxococcales bacterium]|nr:hypothetical protein [Myxococcales bacterium]